MAPPPTARVLALLAFVGAATALPCAKNLVNVKLNWPDYSSYAVLANAADDCHTNDNKPCNSCYLYRLFSEPAATAGKRWSFSIGKPGVPPDPTAVAAKDHILVMPAPACRGVEEWRTNKCGRGDIWDQAWNLVKTSPSKRTKAFAINTTKRRTMHQMHVHVALLDPALKAFLTSVPVDAPTWKYADCTGGQNLRCTDSAQPTTVAAKCMSVNAGRGPSDASPFETVYSTYNSVATMSATTAVYSPRDNVFCVLQATDRSAECLLKCKTECQAKTGIKCP